jgi:hypothetical protein
LRNSARGIRLAVRTPVSKPSLAKTTPYASMSGAGILRLIPGLCGPEYYREALSRIRDSDGHPAFFVFSDDLDWARSNLPLRCQEAVFVGHNGPELPWEDLRLMSLCRRFILANSSFSWWAAWLCRRRDREVLAPRAWFSPASGLDTRDLCPPDWVRL